MGIKFWCFNRSAAVFIQLEMNQTRVNLARRVVNIRPALCPPTILRQSVRRGGLDNIPKEGYQGSWGVLLKKTADHGQEFLVLCLYAGLTLMLIAYQPIYKNFWKPEIKLMPSNSDINDQFNVNFNWNDPRGQKTMGLLTRRNEMFWQNKLGWKDDLKDLLNEIYAFNKPGILKPSTIAVPSAFDGMSKSMILQEDQNKSTELMREALKEVLSEQ